MIKLFAVLLLSFCMYFFAIAMGIVAMIYGWGISPVNWWLILMPAFASALCTITLGVITEAIKNS